MCAAAVIASVCEADVREIAESANGVQDLINFKLGQVRAFSLVLSNVVVLGVVTVFAMALDVVVVVVANVLCC